jgi:hypothetical protein
MIYLMEQGRGLAKNSRPPFFTVGFEELEQVVADQYVQINSDLVRLNKKGFSNDVYRPRPVIRHPMEP